MALVSVVIATGCGDSANSETPTKAEFVASANEACLEAVEGAATRIGRAYEEGAGITDEAEGIRFEVQKLVPILVDAAQRQATAIRDLGAPEDERQQVSTLLDSYELWVEKADAAPLRMVVANNVYNEARSRAKALGLDDCWKNPFRYQGS